MKKHINCLFLLTLFTGCAPKEDVVKYGQLYKKHQDFKSLVKAVELMPTVITTQQVKEYWVNLLTMVLIIGI